VKIVIVGVFTVNDARNDDPDVLDSSPDELLLTYLGSITMRWSTVEAEVSAALFGQLTLDDVQFTILLGRLELLPKLQKLRQILMRSSDPEKVKIATDICKRVEKLKPDRNALVHGVYQGKSKRGEYAFAMTAEILFEEGEEPSKTMRVFTKETLVKHLAQVDELSSVIQDAFDSPKMRKLHSGTYRVPQRFRVDPSI
jgi:hypothetical protein